MKDLLDVYEELIGEFDKRYRDLLRRKEEGQLSLDSVRKAQVKLEVVDFLSKHIMKKKLPEEKKKRLEEILEKHKEILQRFEILKETIH